MSPMTAEGESPGIGPPIGVIPEQSSRTVNSSPTSNKETIPAEPRPAAVAFVTTEHFTLQGARSATISESIGRASMFLASLSGGLVALGLLATATHVGTAFYAFGLVVLPTCAVLGLVTFQRTLQSGIEDQGYARRIAHLRAYYFDAAPELLPLSGQCGGIRQTQNRRVDRGTVAEVPYRRRHRRRHHSCCCRVRRWPGRPSRLPLLCRLPSLWGISRRGSLDCSDAPSGFGLEGSCQSNAF